MMNVLTFAPHASLTPYVAQFIVVKSDSVPGPSFNMVPRNYPVFIFTSPDMLTVDNFIGNHTCSFEKNNIYYAGLGTEPEHMHIRENSFFIVALLKPAFTSMFLKENAFAFTNQIHRITDMNKELRILHKQLWSGALPISKQIGLIESFLFKLIDIPSQHLYILRAMEAIHDSKGTINVHTLAEKSFTCNRNLQRLFKQYVGVNPKQYISMVRFNSFMKEYISSPNTHIETLSEKYNYYDLSHLHKTFIRYLGTAPTFSLTGDQTVNKLLL